MGIQQVLEAVAVTAELTGTSLSAAAQAMMVKDLSGFPEDRILKAFDRFRRESRNRLTLPGIIELIEEEDGRPSADEAWAMCPRSEGDSVFWTTEIQTALGIARPVLESGDKVGARRSFIEAYERLVRDARAAKARPQWSLSMGWDKSGRAEAVQQAITRGLISQQAAQQLLPAPDVGLVDVIAGQSAMLRLTDATDDERQQALRGVAMVRAKLNELDASRSAREAEAARCKAARDSEFESNRTRQLAAAAEKLQKQSGGTA